jgi:uroporphyrinogen decarboxylase
MTHKERVLNALNRKPVDLLPYSDSLWGETLRRYIDEGHMRDGEDVVEHFDMSSRGGGWIDSLADLDFEDELIEETEETILKLNGNGARLRWWKHKAGTPEHVGFSVTDRASWEEQIKPHLLEVDPRRIPFDGYKEQRRIAAEQERAFFWSGVAPFEQMHPVCGHEYMLMGMALDPDWVKDMVMTYADFTIRHLETLFDACGLPDAIWFYEDMGFKEKPFMSPAMYGEIVQPGHKRLFDFAHGKGLKVVVHSCGFVEPLVPGLVEAGMDCLQAMEVKAGMDMPRSRNGSATVSPFAEISTFAKSRQTTVRASMPSWTGSSSPCWRPVAGTCCTRTTRFRPMSITRRCTTSSITGAGQPNGCERRPGRSSP